MGLRVRWELDGLVFNDDADPDGNQWLITDESGWSGSPPVRSTDSDRVGDHGAYPAPVWHTARTIELSGRVDCPSWEARRRAEHRLAGLATDPSGLYPLRCTEETGDLQAEMQRSDATMVSIGPGGYALTFTIALRAPDPRKYEAEQQQADAGLPIDGAGLDFEVGSGSGLDFEVIVAGNGPGLDFGSSATAGRATAVNSGSADTSPSFVLRGPLTAPIVISRPDNGARLTYLDPLPATDTVVIDIAARTALLDNTTTRRHRCVVPDWDALAIPPASTVDYALTHNAVPNSDARLSVRWRSAWW